MRQPVQLQRLVAQEALIGAFYDCFLIPGLVALATTIPTLFLTGSRTRNRLFCDRRRQDTGQTGRQ